MLNDAEAKFIGEHFVMHAGGNCDGASSFSPHSHEKAAAFNAARAAHRLFASCPVLRALLMSQAIPGHSIDVVRALKSRLWATPGGKGA